MQIWLFQLLLSSNEHNEKITFLISVLYFHIQHSELKYFSGMFVWTQWNQSVKLSASLLNLAQTKSHSLGRSRSPF